MRFVSISLIIASCASFGVACAPHLAQPAAAPGAPPPATQENAVAWKAVPPHTSSLAPNPEGTPPPPESCAALSAHATSGCDAAGAADAREALAAALENPDASARDAALGCLEAAPALPPGLVRALRAELAPAECADALALPFIEANLARVERPLADTLIALSVAGRLERLVRQAPALEPPFDKSQFMAFFASTLKPWIVAQANAIQALAAQGPRLSPYAKAVVAVESGLADMRFVSVVRDVPLPDEMKSDAEVRDVYYGALDEALEPRKLRGRDAALVGLRELAALGVIHAARVDQARALLAQLFSGRRIDSLDPLLLPELAPAAQGSVEQRLAARLPTFYADTLLAGAPLDEPLLRAFLEQGLPARVEQRLKAGGAASDASKELYARALIERGRRFVRAADFHDAKAVAAGAAHASDALALYGALGSALELGYKDASEILQGRLLDEKQIQIAELDKVAARSGSTAALAAFDAALLSTLPARNNDAKYWNELASRFAKAEPRLDKRLRPKAHQYAEAMRQMAKQVRPSPAK